MGSTLTHLSIVNQTTTDIATISVSEMDNFDWVGKLRPDNEFNGTSIKAGQSKEGKANMYSIASHCPFKMTLLFKDGTRDTFRIHQKYVTKCCPGFQHSAKSHNITYQKTANLKLTITIRDTEEKLQDEAAKARNKEGQEAMKQMNFDDAISKFDEALTLANGKSTIDSIERNKREACAQYGEKLLQEGWELEGDTVEDKWRDARGKFAKAETMFEQALEEDAVKLVRLKIEANEIFNQADWLENEAFVLFDTARDSSDYTKARSRYEEALERYNEAKRMFQEGAKVDPARFDGCVDITNEQIEEVSRAIDDITATKLNHNVRQVKVGEEGDDEADLVSLVSVKSVLHEQLDSI